MVFRCSGTFVREQLAVRRLSRPNSYRSGRSRVGNGKPSLRFHARTTALGAFALRTRLSPRGLGLGCPERLPAAASCSTAGLRTQLDTSSVTSLPAYLSATGLPGASRRMARHAASRRLPRWTPRGDQLAGHLAATSQRSRLSTIRLRSRLSTPRLRGGLATPGAAQPSCDHWRARSHLAMARSSSRLATSAREPSSLNDGLVSRRLSTTGS
jgi:hypothetical protein